MKPGPGFIATDIDRHTLLTRHLDMFTNIHAIVAVNAKAEVLIQVIQWEIYLKNVVEKG